MCSYMAELFERGEKVVEPGHDVARAAGLAGLLSLLVSVAAVVLTVGFFAVVLGGIYAIFAFGPPLR